MRTFIIIGFLLSTVTCYSQPDCRSIEPLLQKLWKHDTGSASWKRVSDSVLAICPNSARLWMDKGQAYLLRGDFIEGMKFINKAAKIDPYYYLGSRAWYRLYYLHDYENAIYDLDTLERISGRTFVYVTNVHMYILKGVAYYGLHDSAKALSCFDHAIEEQVREKGDKWVGTYDYLIRGTYHYNVGNYEDALRDLTRQVKEYEALADTYYYRGLSYAAVGRNGEAKSDLEHARELMLGAGEKRWEPVFVYPNEVFLSNIDAAIARLY